MAVAAGQPTRALAAARPGAGAPLRPQRPGPARPETRGLGGSLACAAWARPDPETFAWGSRAGGEASTGPGPAWGVRVRSPRAKARTARRVRGALPWGGRQSWHKTKVRVRGGGGGRGAAAREDTGSQGRPGAAGVRGSRGVRSRPSREGSGGVAGTALRSAPQPPSPDCSVSGAAAGDTRAGRSPAKPGAPQPGAPILINALIRGRH